VESHLSTRLYYSTTAPVSLKELAASLAALDRVVQRSPKVMEQLIPGLRVKRIEAFPLTISEGSLLEDIGFKLISEYQEKLEDRISEAGGHLGIEALQDDSQLISWIIIALVAVGCVFAYRKIFPSAPSLHIEGNNNVIFNVGRDLTGVDPDQLRAIVESAAGNKHQIAADAVGVLKPARGDRRSSFSAGGHHLSPDYINEVPFAVPVQEDDDVEDLTDAEVHVRATDRDNTKSGWSAIVPEVSERRIKMHVSPGIDIDSLARSRIVRGRISVIRRRAKDNQLKPALIMLHEIHEMR
jgi:hypothetical protein